MAEPFRINVRTLAEFYTEGGDLNHIENAMKRMHEGLLGHQAIQAGYAEGWEKEVSLALNIDASSLPLRLYGRADGICRACVPPIVEEIKTVERNVHEIHADDMPAHWVQAELYGSMLCESESYSCVQIRLIYMNLSGEKTCFTRSFTREALHERMLLYVAPYAKWLSSLLAWRSHALPSMRAFPFPFDHYRTGQREMAANIYVALRDKKNLLCQAPTGVGKTAAALYPALKALGEGKIDRIFFLTARTTGQRAAEENLDRMRSQGLIARSVTLTARDKVCLHSDLPCRPETCARAHGYFDRRRAALYEALSLHSLSSSAISALAEKHELCPFEFSLDLCETADVIICDYNYVFDPRVKLQRFFSGRSNAGVLIDEAHHLCTRARDMLSASLSLRLLSRLRVRIRKESGRKHSLYKALSPLIHTLKEMRSAIHEESILNYAPIPLIEAIRTALPSIAEHLSSSESWRAAASDVFLHLTDFMRCAEGYNENFRTLLQPDGKSMLDVTLWCVNPAPHLSRTLKRTHGAALFSATLAPMPFYRDLIGLSEENGDALLDLPSAFPEENMLALRAPIPVRYQQRERSLPLVAALIHSFVSARTGNYLIFFSSYAYLHQTQAVVAPMLGDNVRLIVQDREMDDSARERFLLAFQPDPKKTIVGMAVLGGAFAESVDLKDNRLAGAVIVGTGVPQICPANDALKAFCEGRFSNGYRYAYLYPGVMRVVQAAGRVIRSETDTGAVLLIDSRWMDDEHVSLLPSHWKLETVRSAAQLTARLAEFWDSFSGK